MISHKSKGFVYPEYISPLPADEFIKGALLKQQMYDEGVEKVQQQLDTYGQIRKNLLKEEDKAYFDQEATKLVNALNKNAGLDFANKNNLRSALSLGKNLVNDPVIANASESAATYQKMMDEYRKLDPKNRSSVNDYFFFKDLNGWLKDGKTGSKLNYNPYTVYTDEHVKLWKELSTSLKPEEAEYPVFDPKDNKWVIQKKYSGVTAQRFRDAYMNGLSAQARAQLEMEARYTLETGDRDQITSFYTQDLNNKLTSLNLELEKDTQQLAEINAKYGDKSPEALRLKERITSATNTLNFYQEKQSKELNDNDLIGFLRDDKVLDAAGAFAYKNESSKLEANPYVVDYYKMQNNIAEARAKAAIDIEKEAELVRRGLKDGATNAMLSAGAYAPDATYTSKPALTSMRDIYGQVQSGEEGAQIQLGLQRFGEGKTVAETLARAADERNWDPTDRRTIDESFLPSDLKGLSEEQQNARMRRANQLTEAIFWKFKGIYESMQGNRPIATSKDTEDNVNIKPGSIISIKEVNGGVRDMSVATFLNMPGDYLARIEEIRVPKF